MIVLVCRHTVREPPIVLTYVATQTVPAWHIVTWIELHIAIKEDIVLELNQLEIQPEDEITGILHRQRTGRD